MGMVGETPSLESTFPGYKQRRREGVSEVLQEALMMLVAPSISAARMTGKLIQFPKKKRTLESLLENIKAGRTEEIFDPLRVTAERFSKDPDKYSKFLVGHYKLTDIQDPDVLQKAAQRVLNRGLESGNLRLQDRARIVLMRIGRPDVVR